MIDICKRIYNSLDDPLIYKTRGNTGFYPSQASVKLNNGEIAGGCHRQIYYQWKNFEPTEPSVVDYIFAAEMGNWIHDGILSYLEKHVVSTGLIVLSAEQSFYNLPGMVSGRTDLFLQDIETKKNFGVEVKSVGGFAGKDSLLQPSFTHLLQTAIYLHEYQETSKQGYADINSWIILYISRDEGWDLKARKHGSIFKYMWQFTCQFEDDILVVYDQRGGKTTYPEIAIKNIYSRYDKIKLELSQNILPDRDFIAQYSETKIVTLHQTNQIKFKKDIAVVDKWMAKGAKPGKLDLQLGDKEFMFCAWKTLCYSNDPSKGTKAKQKLFNLEKETPKKTKISVNLI